MIIPINKNKIVGKNVNTKFIGLKKNNKKHLMFMLIFSNFLKSQSYFKKIIFFNLKKKKGNLYKQILKQYCNTKLNQLKL